MRETYLDMLRDCEQLIQDIDNQCIQGCQKLSDLLQSKIEGTQQLLNNCEQQTNAIKRNKQSYFESIRVKQNHLDEIKMENNLRKKAIQLQSEHVRNLQSLRHLNVKALQSTQSKNNQILKKYNNKLLVKQKLSQMSQNSSQLTTSQRQKNLISSRKNFSKINIKSLANSDKKNLEDVIQFCSQSNQLHVNIKTAGGHLYDFVLYYDRNEEKFGLKNPRKNLRSCDVLAVRNFNIHQDNVQLYRQLRQAILNNVQDVFL